MAEASSKSRPAGRRRRSTAVSHLLASSLGFRPCPRRHAGASSAAGSGCCPASGACACRSRGPGCRIATRGRSPRATAIVLVDTGMHEPGSMAHLERALDQVNLRLEHVRSAGDHPRPLRPLRPGRARSSTRAGCPMWMHPNDAHIRERAQDPEAVLAHRVEIARTSGVPEEPLRRLARSRAAAGASASRASSSPTATWSRASRCDTDLGAVARARDPGPRALPRLSLPARAPRDDLRRPRARPRVDLLRLRLDARPGRRVPRPRSTRRTSAARASASRATASRSPRSTATSRATGRWSPGASTLPVRRSPTGRAPPSRRRRWSSGSP